MSTTKTIPISPPGTIIPMPSTGSIQNVNTFTIIVNGAVVQPGVTVALNSPGTSVEVDTNFAGNISLTYTDPVPGSIADGVADGADITQGAKADPPATDNTGPWSIASILKGIWGFLNGVLQVKGTRLDGDAGAGTGHISVGGLGTDGFLRKFLSDTLGVLFVRLRIGTTEISSANPVPTREGTFATQVDYAGGSNPIYVGEAAPGSAATVGVTVWRIKKLTYDANGNVTAIGWCNGANTFVNDWTTRGAQSYS